MASVIGWLFSAVFLLAFLAVGYFVLATQRIAKRAERLVPPAGKFVDIDGNRIHFVDKGEGRPIVFVHGLGGQLHHFLHPTFPLLPGFRLIALDRPGSGYSVRGADATARLPEQARVVADFIRELGLRAAAAGGPFARRNGCAYRCHEPSGRHFRRRGACAADAYGTRDTG